MNNRRLSLKWSAMVLAVFTVITFILPSYTLAELQQGVETKTIKQKVTVKTNSALIVNDTRDITSSFDGISVDAAAAGLSDAELIGAVTTEKYNEDATRVKIVWHTLEKQTLGQSYREKLEEPLTSSVIVKVEDIPPATNMIATGNLDVIADAFNKILEKEEGKEPEKRPESSIEESQEKKPLRANASNSGGGYSQNEEPTKDGIKAKVIPDDMQKQEFCGYRSDIATLKMFKQVRTDILDGVTGEVTVKGKCEDSGDAIVLTKKYGGDCSVTPNLEDQVVYQYYRVMGQVDGFTQIVQDCTMDFENTLPIKATFSQCGVINDFVNGEAIQQERLYYLSETLGEVQVRGCENSTQTYPITTTSNGCDPIVDLANGVVHPQFHLMYKNNLGETIYPTDCSIPAGSSGISILDEVCSPKYEHDFKNGQSYLMKRQYYNYDGSKVYLTSCGKSTETYPHLKFTSSCGVEYKDASLSTDLLALTAIDTPNGQIEIAPCAVINTVSHVYNGYKMMEYSTYAAPAIKHIRAAACTITGSIRGYSLSTSFTWANGATLSKGTPWNSTTADSCGNGKAYKPFCTIQSALNLDIKGCTFTRVKSAAQKDYIRYDGSHFKKWDLTITNETVGRN